MPQISHIFFRTYKATFLTAIQHVLDESRSSSLDEAAFPAYAHPNPLISWLFWRRLYIVMNNVIKSGPHEAILDFGCGSGVLLPFLAQHSQIVFGLDNDLQPYQAIQRYFGFPSNVQALDSLHHPLQQFQTASFDLITALDVLEHVEDLPTTVDQLLRLLKPGGRLIVSGPTENVFYRMGRRFAGKEFSGAYHERGITEIKNLAQKKGKIRNLGVLYPPIPLFEIFYITP
jgi:2-polyprenyl-3-methyl-5-hydroxy-6-metoxy-1,4-benzoquinol methylase